MVLNKGKNWIWLKWTDEWTDEHTLFHKSETNAQKDEQVNGETEQLEIWFIFIKNQIPYFITLFMDHNR